MSIGFILFVVAGALYVSGQEEPTVTIGQGKLQGSIGGKTDEGRTYLSFQGIPFAQPPLKNLRFRHPQRAEPWEGVLDASPKLIECIQVNVLNHNTVAGTEDCLYLNIFTENLPEKFQKLDLKPVIVNIHGGGFAMGSNNPKMWGPQYFIDKEVVLVIPNYRLGALGFMSTGGDVIPGNLGLWDQRMALEWVQENIAAFGGDPKRVTILGESAGGNSVMFHYLSPASEGLFQAAIAQSGPALSGFSRTDKHPSYYFRSVAEVVGCDPKDTLWRIRECLRDIDAEYLESKAKPLFHHWSFFPYPFKPRVDDDTSEPFLPREPIDMIEDGQFNHVPLIIGANQDEGIMFPRFISEAEMDLLQENWETLGPLLLLYREPEDVTEEDLEIVDMYLKKFHNGVIPSSKTPPKQFFQMLEDKLLTQSTITARLLAEKSRAPVYEYIFSHVGSFSFHDLLSMKPWQFVVKAIASKVGLNIFSSRLGTCHADEILLMFSFDDLPFSPRETADDVKAGDNMVAMCAEFARDPQKFDDALGIQWERLGGENTRYMNISSSMKMDSDPVYEDRVKFWTDIFNLRQRPVMHARKSPSWKNNKLYKRKLEADTTKARKVEL